MQANADENGFPKHDINWEITNFSIQLFQPIYSTEISSKNIQDL